MTGGSRVARRTQRGSVTPMALVAALLLGVGGLSSAVLGGAVTAQRRVESAADLAALAGAAELQVAGDGCAAARDVARANGAALERCAVTGEEVEVTATRPLAVPVVGDVTVRGRARAGPSSARTGPGLRPP